MQNIPSPPSPCPVNFQESACKQGLNHISRCSLPRIEPKGAGPTSNLDGNYFLVVYASLSDHLQMPLSEGRIGAVWAHLVYSGMYPPKGTS